MKTPRLLLLFIAAAHALAPARRTHALTDAAGKRREALELPDGRGRRTFVLADQYLVRVRETDFSDGKLGYAVWPAAVAGAIWAADRPELFGGKRVLELGAGVGLFGLAVAAASDAEVTLSDLDGADGPSGLLDQQRANAQLNGLDERVRARALDWTDDGDDEAFDVVLAADCVYAPEAVAPLARALRRHLAPGGVAYVLSVDRDWSDAKYERASPADLERELRSDGWCAVAETRWTVTTAKGDSPLAMLEIAARDDATAGAPSVTRRGLGALGAAAFLPARARAATTTVTFKGDKLGLELADVNGRVQISRVREGTEAFALGVTPLAFIVAVEGRPCKGATAAEVGVLLRNARRPVAVELDAETAYAGLGVGEAFERMAQAQGNPTARVTIEKVYPSEYKDACMRSRDADVVEIDYEGTLANGAVFDSRRRYAAMLGNGELVKGLELGVFEMCIGERRIIRVPPLLGFGSRGSKLFNVPPDATLEYDVTLRSINLQYDPSVRREDLDFEQRYK